MYCCKAHDVLDIIEDFDCVITDLPYGVSGGKGRNRARKKAIYNDNFPDTPEYIKTVCVPTFSAYLEKSKKKRAAATIGNRNIQLYPAYTDIGNFYIENSIGLSQWGVQKNNIILYYGKDPYPQKMKSTSIETRERPPKIGHPCPKPIKAWTWLVERASLPGETVLDPFMGSGTTGVSCINLGRKFIGIDLDKEYFDLSCKRIQEFYSRLFF